MSVTPHGLDGPLRGTPGNTLTACARTGWAKINGVRDQPPLQLPVRLVSYVAGIAAFNGGAAACLSSPGPGLADGGPAGVADGRPQRARHEVVDVSELEAIAMCNVPWARG